MIQVRRYVVHVCPQCGTQASFAGFCDETGCNGRLVSTPAVPVSDIQEFQKQLSSESSPVPAWFFEHFVKELFKRSSRAASG